MGETLRPDDTPNNPPRTYEVEEPTLGWVSRNTQFSEMSVGLLYSREDPICVTLRFYDPDGGNPTDWQFSRSLLSIGYFEQSGGGDVRIEPRDDDNIVIKISPPKVAPAQVVLPQHVVRSFLDKAYKVVPARDEDAIVSEALEVWLAELSPTAENEP